MTHATEFDIFIRVDKPARAVFQAVQQPQHLQKYFAQKRVSAPLTEGATVMLDFADFPGEFPIFVKKVVANSSIAFDWKAQDGDYNTHVEFTFEPQPDGSTMVRVKESGWQQTAAGIKSSYGNCFGWTHMLCCLKAYMDHGILLREGSFKPIQKAA